MAKDDALSADMLRKLEQPTQRLNSIIIQRSTSDQARGNGFRLATPLLDEARRLINILAILPVLQLQTLIAEGAKASEEELAFSVSSGGFGKGKLHACTPSLRAIT